MVKRLRVAVIGPKGQSGSCVVDELLTRNHDVVGVSRNPPKEWNGTGNGSYTSISVDIYTEQNKLIEIFSSDFDAIVCAFGPSLANLANVYMDGVEAHGRIKTALLASTHQGPFVIIGTCYNDKMRDRDDMCADVVVTTSGGAGSIHVANRLQLTDQRDFAFSWWYVCRLLIPRQPLVEPETHCSVLRWTWPDEHLDYMIERGLDHGSRFLSLLATLMKWSRSHIQRPRCESAIRLYYLHRRQIAESGYNVLVYSWVLSPITYLVQRWLKHCMTDKHNISLITMCRIAFTMWNGVTEKSWSFLSPPGLLRDKGQLTASLIHFEQGTQIRI